MQILLLSRKELLPGLRGSGRQGQCREHLKAECGEVEKTPKDDQRLKIMSRMWLYQMNFSLRPINAMFKMLFLVRNTEIISISFVCFFTVFWGTVCFFLIFMKVWLISFKIIRKTVECIDTETEIIVNEFHMVSKSLKDIICFVLFFPQFFSMK